MINEENLWVTKNEGKILSLLRRSGWASLTSKQIMVATDLNYNSYFNALSSLRMKKLVTAKEGVVKYAGAKPLRISITERGKMLLEAFNE